jgi:hypothetical protein
MSTESVSERARPEVQKYEGKDARVLGHPAAFLATAAILLALFGWTFIANQDRVAPTKDPAYYTWRTETQVSEDPQTLLGIEGAYDMFSGGYRVVASEIGGFLRRIPAVSTLNVTVLLMVGVPVLTALLVAGFAYRHRRDPLLFHSVAFGVASLYLTPPFVGYLDNILCLMFLAAALWFIGPARTTWAGRFGLALFLLLAGFTHPTTLAFFGFTLGVASLLKLIFRRFDIRSVVREDGAMLLTALAAALLTAAVWTVGIWGKSASLTEAALPPPYDNDFFLERMGDWISQMTPLLNGPLFLIGLVGLFVAGKRWVEDDFSLLTFAWLAPLGGLFGFVGGLTYPYYRFFNTTLAWVLLVGLGAYLLIRFVGNRLTGTAGMAASIVVAVAVGAIFAFNFSRGYDSAHWNEADKGWLSTAERLSLDSLRASLLARLGSEKGEGGLVLADQIIEEDRPVVFVIDSETEGFQVWGDAKLAGNTSRYGLPAGLIDQGYLYLGAIENFLTNQPTFREGDDQPTEECDIKTLGDNTYNCLSFALFEDAKAGIEEAGTRPIAVVVDVFNTTGENVDFIESDQGFQNLTNSDTIPEIWKVKGDEITIGEEKTRATIETNDPGWAHILRVILCLLLMFVPGALAIRYFFPDASFGESVAMVPVLSIGLLTLVGMVVLAILRSPMTTLLAWEILALCMILGGFLMYSPRKDDPESPADGPGPEPATP